MKVEYNLNRGEGPDAENLLPAYEPSRFFHERRRQRPPDGIYSMSLRQAWPAFGRALNAAELIAKDRPFLTNGDPSWQHDCLDAVEHLLYVMVEYIEDCDVILKCCFPSEEKFQQDDHANRFRQTVKPYRSRIAAVVNAIKHNQGRLRLFAFHGPEFVAPGYFLEGVLPNGAIGPSTIVHGNNASQAFSFAFDLRLHFALIFLVGRNLARAVEKIFGPPDHQRQPGSSSSYAREFAARLEAFSRTVFPDEIRQAFPEITLRTSEQVLEVEYPSAIPVVTVPNGLVHHWVAFDVANGTADRFVPPYADPAQPISVGLIRSVLDSPGHSGGA